MNDTAKSESTMPEHVIGAGAVVLRNGETGLEVLLIRRGKPPRLGEWSIPGGRQEMGETVRETAIREIKEETGLTIADLNLIDVVDTFQTNSAEDVTAQWILIDFCAWWAGDIAQADSDATEVRWVPVTELDRYNLWSKTSEIILRGAGLPSILEKTR